MQNYDLLYKICMLGDSGVGKSCIVRRFVDNAYSDKFMPTVGADFGTRTIEDDNGKITKCHVWDTAGQERFRSLTAATIRGSHGAVFVFDITDRDSFLAVQHTWIQELDTKVGSRDRVVKLLVGNKSDLSDRRAVSFQEAQAYAEGAGMAYLETSAKDDVNIMSAFRLMVSVICSSSAERNLHNDHTDTISLPEARPRKPICSCG